MFLELDETFDILRKDLGFSEEDLGKIFISTLAVDEEVFDFGKMEYPMRCFLSNIRTHTGRIVNLYKNDFQKFQRNAFNHVKNSLYFGMKEKNGFIKESSFICGPRESIEKVTRGIITSSSGEIPYDDIFNSLKDGAADYHEIKKSTIGYTGKPWRLDMEYDCILKKLNNLYGKLKG